MPEFLRYIVLLAVIATVRVSCAAQSQPLSTPEKGIAKHGSGGSTEESATPNKDNKSAPNVTVIVNQEKSPSTDSDENKNKEDIKIQRELARFTGWLVFVGLIQAGVLAFTLVMIAKQANLMEKHAGHLENLAIAAKSNRAWVLVEIGKAPAPTGDALIYWILPTIKNHGKNPAQVLKTAIRQHQVPQPNQLPPVPQYTGEHTYNFILPPDVAMRPMSVALIPDDFQKIGRHESFLYVYGFIDYLDVGRDQHQTRFCFLYHTALGADPAPDGFYMASEVPAAYTECT